VGWGDREGSGMGGGGSGIWGLFRRRLAGVKSAPNPYATKINLLGFRARASRIGISSLAPGSRPGRTALLQRAAERIEKAAVLA
jgi:hypothetical protein